MFTMKTVNVLISSKLEVIQIRTFTEPIQRTMDRRWVIVLSCVIVVCQVQYGDLLAVEGQACSQLYNNQDNCDTDSTKLECYFGRCSCPARKFYRNVPLNTYWYDPWSKCVSLLQSGCDLNTFGNGGTVSRTGYQCQPGLTCRSQAQFNDPNVGVCRGSLPQPAGIIYVLAVTLVYFATKL